MSAASNAVRLSFGHGSTAAYGLKTQSWPPELATRYFPFDSATFALKESPESKPWDGRSLLFRQAVSSPLGLAPLSERERLLHFYIYHPRDLSDILEFDARITGEYTNFYSTQGMSYLGTFHVNGPEATYVGEINVFDTTSVEEAERLGDDARTDSIERIEAECRALQDRERPRYRFWLLPTVAER